MSPAASRRSVVLAFAALAALPAVFAIDPALARQPEIFTGLVRGVAVSGYDAVAYFTEGKPVKGDSAITFEHGGAVWRFASTANRDAFQADPAKYAPQFGGYCAWAVSQGYTAQADPAAWTIVDGKLYLNYNSAVKKRWEVDAAGNITRGQANWPKVLDK